MIILLTILITIISIILSESYIINKKYNRLINYRINAVPEWLATPTDASEIPIDRPTISIRFINTVDGKDIVGEILEGDNLLAVGDRLGVKLPRACRTGLCGSCTCDIQDPNAIATVTNPRDGYATIRACSTKCFVPEGMNEMVIDVHRMRKNKSKSNKLENADDKSDITDEDTYIDPMARFSGDWEKEFRPQWELAKSKPLGLGQVGGASDPKSKSCNKCSGTSRVVCYACSGQGLTLMDGKKTQCFVCVGAKTVGCGYCRGTGIRKS
mmetsp:Transcript_9096/g.8131  ORF Transcript_9096/g.8131 Transcript_9096/m.8131 type:complete len:269 (+) Transcript_9096:32-838(+)